MNWNNVSLAILALAAFLSAFTVALWLSLTIWTFRDLRARTRDAFAQLLAALMVLVLGPMGIILYLILRPRETLAEKYERSLEEEALLQDIEERTVCPACKQPIEHDYVLCPVCHTRLRQPCIHCGRLMHPRWSLCPYCAQPQTPAPAVERSARVTLLDLEKELELTTPIEDEPALQLATQPPAKLMAELTAEPLPNSPMAKRQAATDEAVIDAVPSSPTESFAAPLELEWEELGLDAREEADDEPSWDANSEPSAENESPDSLLSRLNR